MSRASWSKLGGGRLRRDCPDRPRARLGLGQGHGVPAVGARAAAPSARPPRYPKAPPTNGHLPPPLPRPPSPQRPALRRAPPPARAAPPRPGSAPRHWARRLRLAGQHDQAHVLSRVLGQLRAEGLRGCKPRGPCTYEVRRRLSAVCSAAQTARDGGRALTVVRQRVGLRVSSRSSSTKRVPP